MSTKRIYIQSKNANNHPMKRTVNVNAFKEYLLINNLTQLEFASRSKKSPVTVIKVMKGKLPSIRTMGEFSSSMAVELDVLFPIVKLEDNKLAS